MNPWPLLAMAALAATLVLLGSRFSWALAGPGEGTLYRGVISLLAGALIFHLLLTLLQLAGLAWNPLLVGGALLTLCALAHAVAATRLPLRRAAPVPSPSLPALAPPGRWRSRWGEALALAALLAFALLAASSWIATPDFVYHWGLKGHRFFLARGVDYAYLAKDWNWVIHPDYPNLLPELYAATALLGGSFAEPAMMLWSAAWFALLLAALRQTLFREVADRCVAQAALALIALAVAAFAINSRLAGAADWMIALALAAAMPPLLRPRDRSGDLEIGVIAAFAAMSKVEGVPLAALLVAAQWARGIPRQAAIGALDPRAAAALFLPTAAVAVPWLAEIRRHHLFQQFNAGWLDLGRAPLVLAEVVRELDGKSWHGFAFALLICPLLLLERRLRWIAAVITLQLLFYLYVFCSARVDPAFLIRSSFSRLLLHLLPAILAGTAVASRRWTDAPAQPHSETSSRQ